MTKNYHYLYLSVPREPQSRDQIRYVKNKNRKTDREEAKQLKNASVNTSMFKETEQRGVLVCLFIC